MDRGDAADQDEFDRLVAEGKIGLMPHSERTRIPRGLHADEPHRTCGDRDCIDPLHQVPEHAEPEPGRPGLPGMSIQVFPEMHDLTLKLADGQELSDFGFWLAREGWEAFNAWRAANH